MSQIAVLEEFSLCLIIADKSLIAYHLDGILPGSPNSTQDHARHAPQKLSGTKDVSFFATSRMKGRPLVFYIKREGLHSTFKVLEPIYQKPTEKKSRILGNRFGRFGSADEFFREFDEFYIPTECFTINLFQTYIAVSTYNGFELLTLDKKVPMLIPDKKDPKMAEITTRLAGQNPLGMFRVSETEFFLCYEECGIYVDKHGDVSRSVIMEFVCRAEAASIYGVYLVLFHGDFVEIRNVGDGKLRQVITGNDIRCLDYGTDTSGTTAPPADRAGPASSASNLSMGTIKIAMTHPEKLRYQLVLEMVLNESYRV